MDIGPGDFVECVDAAPRAGTYHMNLLQVGEIYVVEQLKSHPKYGDGFYFAGFNQRKPDGLRVWFHITRFRPIYRPKADLIQSLLTNIPEGVEA